MPPPKPPLTAVSEPDPIYPYQSTLLVLCAYLAMSVPVASWFTPGQQTRKTGMNERVGKVWQV